MMRRSLLPLLALFLTWPALADIRYEIAKTLPHDSKAFTEGLFIADGLLYESTGLVGKSDIRAMRLDDMKIVRRRAIRADLFGEGITPWGDRIFSLTWQTGEGFIWRRRDLRQIGTFRYSGEGWGFTSDEHSLIMSDGTPELRFLDPATLKERKRVTVTWQDSPVRYINELEYVDGKIYANIWYSPLIARIDPSTGKVEDWINLAPLVARNAGTDRDAVLNGIAWDRKSRLMYVTGKNWSRLYALRLTD